MPTMWLSDSQKIGVAFCSGGGFFLIGGVIMFFDRAMYVPSLVLYSKTTNQETNSTHQHPQILFLAGITLLLGVQRTFLFFARRQKIKGTAAFVAGIILILLRWPLIGFLVEIYGIFILFGEFFKTIAGFAYNIPVVGPYLARGLQKAGEKAGEGNKNKDLPV
ncbi:Got1-domain-containing protein [Aureobasidium sp. EXF-12298]|nr:Got1-domain-containing protein [Aureobasidium sp. EXF-12298]KAI4753105.1 Got1-domain-containing protein [Aureobasidium sp. EXF-12344]KAI4770221.1 Got1-domain-containing protein [Aureobasidium sp. EXF-3400]